MPLNVKTDRLPRLDRIIPRCKIIDLGSGSAPKFVTVELPFGEQPRVLARWSGSPVIAVNDYVRCHRRGVDGQYDIIGTDAGNAEQAVKNNYSATSAPTAGDDSGDGYSVGSIWIDVSADDAYICLDASSGAAIWEQIDGAGATGIDPAGHTHSKLVASDGSPDPALSADVAGNINAPVSLTSGGVIQAGGILRVDHASTGGYGQIEGRRSDYLRGYRILGNGGNLVQFWLDNATYFKVANGYLQLDNGAAVNDIDTTPANNDNALITSGGVYDHTNASNGVHGLASNEHVLGSNVSGHKVESGRTYRSVAIGSSFPIGLEAGTTFSFPVAFSSTPSVIASPENASSFVGVFLQSVGTTSFVVRRLGLASGTAQGTTHWIAKGA
jgi:hypothetical protein